MSDPSNPQSSSTALNPYKAKRPWPPDLSSLSSKHQFRLERTYKRRAKLKWARPTFMKLTKAAQIVGVGVTLVYGVFFMDWSQGNPGQDEGKVFEPARDWARRTFGEFRSPNRRAETLGKIEGGE